MAGTTGRVFRQHTIAIVYDFDGTLCPQPMQEYTVLPKLGIDGKAFWAEVDSECRREGADQMLTYMRLMLKKLEAADQHLEPVARGLLEAGVDVAHRGRD